MDQNNMITDTLHTHKDGADVNTVTSTDGTETHLEQFRKATAGNSVCRQAMQVILNLVATGYFRVFHLSLQVISLARRSAQT